jgi:NitT/TauT family transport system substrate-binding protein
MPRTLKLALPDFVSNSYFPAVAARELGFFEAEGLDVELEMIYPAPACYHALHAGKVDLVAGSAHLPAVAFASWRGARLLCSLSRGMYWFLIMRRDIGVDRGDLSALTGRRIVAAPGVDLGFKQLLVAANIDALEQHIDIIPLPGGVPKGASFGVAAARAMVAGEIDGFWANGMAAEVAVTSGAGQVILDVRRGDGPSEAFNFTQPTLAATAAFIESQPESARAAVRAINATHRALKRDPSLATQVGDALFPPAEAALIRVLVERDLDYYGTALTRNFVIDMHRFSRNLGLIEHEIAFEDTVAENCADLWL